VAQLRDGRILFYAVDRGAGSPGFTVRQMTKDLARRGARTAMAFDSGGSTAVSVNGRLLNTPADGVERPVGNLLSYVVMKSKYRTPIRRVRVGAVADGQVAQPLSFTLKRRAPVEVQLVQPGGRTRYYDLGSVRRGAHRIRMPKRPKPGRWKVDVAVPAYGDRVVKEFVVRRTPKAAAVTQPPSAPPERARVATPAPATAAAREAGSSPWSWIAAGGAVVVAAGGAGLLAARRRRG